MKIYTALKFSIVVVPPSLSEKTKGSKALVRSFSDIYKIVGFGIAACVSGLLSSSVMPRDQETLIGDPSPVESIPSVTPEQMPAHSKFSSDVSPEHVSRSAQLIESESETADVSPKYPESGSLNVVDPVINLNDPSVVFSEMFVFPAIISIILGGVAIYYLYKFLKKS